MIKVRIKMSKKFFETMDEILTQTESSSSSEGDPLDIEDAERNDFQYAEYIGADHSKIIVKTFTEASYNGPSVRDFIQRLNMMHDVAIKRVRLEPISEAERTRKIEALEKARMECEAALKSDCQISPVALDLLKSREKELDPIVNEAMSYIRKYIYQALAMTAPNAFES